MDGDPILWWIPLAITMGTHGLPHMAHLGWPQILWSHTHDGQLVVWQATARVFGSWAMFLLFMAFWFLVAGLVVFMAFIPFMAFMAFSFMVFMAFSFMAFSFMAFMGFMVAHFMVFIWLLLFMAMATAQFGGCLGYWWQKLVTLGTERPRLKGHSCSPDYNMAVTVSEKSIGKIKHMLVQCHWGL